MRIRWIMMMGLIIGFLFLVISMIGNEPREIDYHEFCANFCDHYNLSFTYGWDYKYCFKVNEDDTITKYNVQYINNWCYFSDNYSIEGAYKKTEAKG